MRRTTAIVAVLLPALLLAALAGCGGDEKTARQYIEAARQTGKAVSQNQAKLQDQAGQLTRFAGIQNPTAQDYADMQKFSSGLVALVDAVNQSAQKAKVEYEKVLDLNGVDKYKRYAEVQVEALGLVDRRSNLVKDFAGIINQVLQAGVADQPIDEAAVTASLQKILDERNALTSQIEKLNEEAITLAQELNLE